MLAKDDKYPFYNKHTVVSEWILCDNLTLYEPLSHLYTSLELLPQHKELIKQYKYDTKFNNFVTRLQRIDIICDSPKTVNIIDLTSILNGYVDARDIITGRIDNFIVIQFERNLIRDLPSDNTLLSCFNMSTQLSFKNRYDLIIDLLQCLPFCIYLHIKHPDIDYSQLINAIKIHEVSYYTHSDTVNYRLESKDIRKICRVPQRVCDDINAGIKIALGCTKTTQTIIHYMINNLENRFFVEHNGNDFITVSMLFDHLICILHTLYYDTKLIEMTYY